MTLVDSSVWIDHLRRSDPILVRLVNENSVAVHPFGIGEVLCGNVRDRPGLIRYFSRLPQSSIAAEYEVHRLLDDNRLWGKGLSWIDLHILVSAAAAGWKVMTADRAMQAAAESIGIAAEA